MSIRKVMLVDDDPDIRKIGQLALEKVGGWETLIASSGPQALTIAAEQRLDVIILDVMMPDVDGPTTLEKLRKLPGACEVPVVFLTAKVQTREIKRYLALGASGVIAKPFDPMSLTEEIDRIVGCALGET